MEKIKWFEGAEESEKIEEIRKETDIEKSISNSIEEALEEGEKLGYGRTADVFKLVDDNSFCVKSLHTKEISPNRTEEEQNLLDFAYRKGLRVPRPFCSVEYDEGEDYLLLEKIEGFSLRDLIEEDFFDQLPEGFNFRSFFGELREQVALMHSSNLYHRDLHAGNIMVDREGNPVIIDFGDAVISHLSSEDPYRQESVTGNKIYPRDEDNIASVLAKVGKYLKEKDFFNKDKKEE